jgi:hypothetical protein
MAFCAPVGSPTTDDVELKAIFLQFQNPDHASSVRFSDFQAVMQSFDGKLDHQQLVNLLASMNQQHVQPLQYPSSNPGYTTQLGLTPKEIKQPQYHTHANHSSCATKYDCRLEFSSPLPFYGTYWRNKVNSLCGFPNAHGMDYMEFQTQNMGQSSSSKRVDICFQINKNLIARYKTIVFKADLHPFRDLPENDVNFLTMCPTIQSMSVESSTFTACSVAKVLKEEYAKLPMKKDGKVDPSGTKTLPGTTTDTEFITFRVGCDPARWTLTGKLGNVKTTTKVAVRNLLLFIFIFFKIHFLFLSVVTVSVSMFYFPFH